MSTPSRTPSQAGQRRGWVVLGVFTLVLLLAGGGLLLLIYQPTGGVILPAITPSAAPTYAPATPDPASSDPVQARLLAWCHEVNPDDIADAYCTAEFAAPNAANDAVLACHSEFPASEIEFRRCVAAEGIRPQSRVN